MALAIIGAGGHAKVVLDAFHSAGNEIAGFYDDDPRRSGAFCGLPMLGSVEEALRGTKHLHLAIGRNEVRQRLASGLADVRFITAVHPRAWVSPTATVSPGCLLGAGSVIQACAQIGRHSIINSLALVEHDVVIGDFAHVAPGVRLGGGVKIGEGALLGMGAIVIPGVQIGAWAVVGAGAVVIRDVVAGNKVIGNPARLLDGSRPICSREGGEPKRP